MLAHGMLPDPIPQGARASWMQHGLSSAPKKMGQEVSQITRRFVRLPRVLWDLQMEWQGRDEIE